MHRFTKLDTDLSNKSSFHSAYKIPCKNIMYSQPIDVEMLLVDTNLPLVNICGFGFGSGSC